MPPLLILAVLAAPPAAPPLFYWGGRGPLIERTAAEAPSIDARVLEVHGALTGRDLMLRLTFDRPVREALALPDGTPVSGRLQAVLYLDVDDDRKTGLDRGPADLTTGSERRLTVGVLYLGEDKQERRQAAALVTAELAALEPDGQQRRLWQADEEAQPRSVSVRGDWIEIRLPGDEAPPRPGSRVVLAAPDDVRDGRVR